MVVFLNAPAYLARKIISLDGSNRKLWEHQGSRANYSRGNPIK
jgi:hypothetical protein